MSDAVLLALIAAVTSTIASTIAAIIGIYGNHKIGRVERQTNGMINLIQESSRAGGYEAGRQAVRAGDRRPTEPEGGRYK